MYALLYNSLESYTIDELTSYRTNIVKLDEYKNKYMQYDKEKGVNNAKYAISILGKKDVAHVEDKKDLKENEYEQSEYSYLTKYAQFFDIFKDTTYSLPIISPTVFTKNVYQIGLEVSQDQTYLTRDDMKLKFNEFVGTEELPDVEKAYA